MGTHRRDDKYSRSGNGHDTLLIFFQDVAIGTVEPETDLRLRTGEVSPRVFDSAIVEGDHTALGTWYNLADVVPHVAVVRA